MNKEKVLFVDDEKNILSSVRRLLHKENYEVHIANSGKEGLELLQKNLDVSVIISDMRMPEMDGVSFLKEARKLCPEAITAILSGYADSEAIMTAVNEGNVWRYLKKPWEDNELKICIKNALEMHQESRERKRLLVELEKKNEELEEKVKQRTWLLQSKTELLDMIVEDYPLDSFIEKSLEIIVQATGAKSTNISIDFLNLNQSKGEFSDISSLEQLRKKSAENQAAVNSASLACLPLVKNGNLLGVLSIEGDISKNLDLLQDKVNGFVSTLILAFAQRKTLQDAPDLMKNVDKLLDGLA